MAGWRTHEHHAVWHTCAVQRKQTAEEPQGLRCHEVDRDGKTVRLATQGNAQHDTCGTTGEARLMRLGRQARSEQHRVQLNDAALARHFRDQCRRQQRGSSEAAERWWASEGALMEVRETWVVFEAGGGRPRQRV